LTLWVALVSFTTFVTCVSIWSFVADARRDAETLRVAATQSPFVARTIAAEFRWRHSGDFEWMRVGAKFHTANDVQNWCDDLSQMSLGTTVAETTCVRL